MNHKVVLITGTSGFIFKHCAVELLQHGYSVRGTVRSASKAEEVKATMPKCCDISSLELLEAALLSDNGWAMAMRVSHGVLHSASPFPLNKTCQARLVEHSPYRGSDRAARHRLPTRLSRQLAPHQSAR